MKCVRETLIIDRFLEEQVVLEHCPEDLCLNIMTKGLLMMYHYKPINAKGDQKDTLWAIRHASLIGIKFWMAVRQDLVEKILTPINGADSPAFIAIVEGLKDSNDDVRAVSSSALIPISNLLVEILPAKKIFDSIVLCLWDSLQDLDDLTAAGYFPSFGR